MKNQFWFIRNNRYSFLLLYSKIFCNMRSLVSLTSFLFFLVFCNVSLVSCTNGSFVGKNERDTVYIHDTIYKCNPIASADTFTYNIPCKIVNIHPELDGKAIMFFWLHGGVRDLRFHDFYRENHFTWSQTDETIAHYLDSAKIKAVFMMPLCSKANKMEYVNWLDCAEDIRHIVDEYAQNGIVDRNRVYVGGSSDGGVGAWDYAAFHGDLFAAAMALSCPYPRNTNIPVFWSNTGSESDMTATVNQMNANGCRITYHYYPQYRHGGDGYEISHEYLSQFFSQVK